MTELYPQQLRQPLAAPMPTAPPPVQGPSGPLMQAAPPQPQQVDPRVAGQRTLKKLALLQQLGPAYGIKPEEIEKFASQKRASLLGQFGVPANKIETDSARQQAQLEQAILGVNTGVSDAGQLYGEQLASGYIKDPSGVPQENRDEALRYLKQENLDPIQIQKQNEGQQIAALLRQVRDTYKQNNIGTGNSVTGGLAGRFGQVGALLNLNDPQKNYQGQKDISIQALRELYSAGQGRGILNPALFATLQGALPGVADNRSYGLQQFDQINQTLQDKYGIDLDGNPVSKPAPGGTKQPAGGIRVQSPDGQTGSIDPTELKDALAAGWKQL